MTDERHDAAATDSSTTPGLWLILALAAAVRFPLLFVLPGVDYPFYLSVGRLSDLGFLPYRDYWLEYPPVFPWLIIGVYRLILNFPPALRYLWEGDALAPTFHLVLGSLVMLADLAGIALVWAIACELWPRPEATRRTIVYAVLFWPLMVALGWYDTLPCTLLLLGLWLLLRHRTSAAGAVAGLGFMTKIFPLLLVPVALKFRQRRAEQAGALASAAAVILAIGLPMFLLGPRYFIASYRVIFERSAWETIWAISEGYFSYGRVAPLGLRFDTATAEYVAYPSRLPTLLITVLALAACAYLWWRPVSNTTRNICLFTGIAMLGFLLYSKGYSPQFVVYALPFTVLLPPWRRALGYTLALSAMNFVQWPLYHEWFHQQAWVLGIAIVLRTALFLLLCWEWLTELWGWRNPLLTWRPQRTIIQVGATALLTISLIIGFVTWQSWRTVTYDTSPLQPAYSFANNYSAGLLQRPAYIFASTELYEAFHPYFASDADFYLLLPTQAGDNPLHHERLTPAGRQAELTDIATTHSRIFLVRNQDDWTSRDLNEWLDKNTTLLATSRVGKVDLSCWNVRQATPR